MKSVVFEDDFQSQRLKKEMEQDVAKHQKELDEYLYQKQLQKALEETFEAMDQLTDDKKKFKIIKKVVHPDTTGVDLDIDKDIVDGKENENGYKIKCTGCGNWVFKIDYNEYVDCCEDCISSMYD